MGVAVATLVVFRVGAISLLQGDPLRRLDAVDRLRSCSRGRDRRVDVALRLDPGRPDAEGLVVRNLFTTRAGVAEIVGVQFAGGAPWVTLDLDDTDTVAVMAIQKADGASAGPRPAAWPHWCRSTGSARAAKTPTSHSTDPPPAGR